MKERDHVLLAWAFSLLAVAGAGTGATLAADQAPAANRATPGEITREWKYIMGTSVEVRASGGTSDARSAAIQDAFAAISEVDRLMSNYRSDSELAVVNRDGAAGPVHVSGPLYSVLDAARLVGDRSGGAFDVTVGPLMRLWGFHDHKPHLPSPDELARVRPFVDCRNVLLDATTRSVRFTQPGVEIDLGGIAKGFAVELAAGVLRRHGLGGFIDAGGNQYMVGAPPGKTTWTVGISDPDHPNVLMAALELPAGSVSTSGGYANFITIDGRRYGHILDPRTLRPSEASLGVTVFARDGTLADALSTAAFVLGPQKGLALVESFPGVLAVIVYRQADGSVGVVMSEGLKTRLHPIKAT